MTRPLPDENEPKENVPESVEDTETIYTLADPTDKQVWSVTTEDEAGPSTRAERLAVAEEKASSAEVYGIQDTPKPFYSRAVRAHETRNAENHSASQGPVSGTGTGEDADTEELSLEEIYARKQKQNLQKQLSGEDEEGFEIKRSELPRHPFLTRIFTPFMSPGFLLRILFVTGAGVIPFFLCTLFFAHMFEKKYVDQNLWGYIQCLWKDRVILVLFSFLWGAISIPFSLNVFDATSDGDDRIDEWPEYSFVGGLGQFLWLVFLIICAGTPGWLLGRNFGWGTNGFLLSAQLLLPPFFLSTMESESPFILLTIDVCRSMIRLWRTWLVFYVIVFVLFAGTLSIGASALCMIHQGGTSILGILVISLVLSFLLSIMPMLYLRWLGRLGWVIEEDNRQRREEAKAKVDATTAD